MTTARDTFDAMQPRQRGLFGDAEHAEVNAGYRSDLIDLVLILKAERPLAIAVVDPAKPGARWVWLPKSQIEVTPRADGHVTVTLRARLAIDKELV